MIHRTKEQWHQLFQQQQDSKLSIANFCQQLDIDKYYFNIRKKQLLPSTEAFVRVAKPSLSKTKIVLPENRVGLQCRLGSCVLQFESLPDVTWLAQLIKALS